MTSSPRELVSVREFARRMGWRSHTYALRLVSAGVLTLVDGKIDPVTAEDQLRAHGHGEHKPNVAARNAAARDERGHAGGEPASAPGQRAAAPAPTRKKHHDQRGDRVRELREAGDLCKARVTILIDDLIRGAVDAIRMTQSEGESR